MTPAQVFSVYDYRRGIYRYYAAPLGDVPASGFYRKARNQLAEGLAERLPSGAKPIGEGPQPQGIIASDGINETVPVLTVKNVAMAGLGSWWIYKAWRMFRGGL